MAISPPTDIVLDVIKAVEPSVAAQARQRLAAIAGSAGAKPVPAFDIPAPSTGARTAELAPASAKPEDALVKFEGMVLQTFIESIMPDDAQNTFGSGLSGDMWKSMLSEKIAGVVAERGGVGIANRLLSDFVMNGENKEAIAGAVNVERILSDGHEVDHAQAMLHDKQRKFLDLLSGWGVADDADGDRT